MIKTHTSYLLIILIVLVIGAVFGCYYFYNLIGGVTEGTVELREKISTSRDQGDRLEAVNKLLADTESERKELEKYIIDVGGEVSFIKSLEKLAKDQGLGIKTSDVVISELATSSTRYEDLRVEIETTGSWQKNMQFLSLLESLPYNSSVLEAVFRLDENLSEPVKNRPKNPLWKGSFEVVVVKRK